MISGQIHRKCTVHRNRLNTTLANPIIFALVEVGFPSFALISFVTHAIGLVANYRKTLLLRKAKLQISSTADNITP
jgi:hypothetical protein